MEISEKNAKDVNSLTTRALLRIKTLVDNEIQIRLNSYKEGGYNEKELLLMKKEFIKHQMNTKDNVGHDLFQFEIDGVNLALKNKI